jgi:hypothetical protein
MADTKLGTIVRLWTGECGVWSSEIVCGICDRIADPSPFNVAKALYPSRTLSDLSAAEQDIINAGFLLWKKRKDFRETYDRRWADETVEAA